MKVLVDTDVWSESFRKKSGAKSEYVHELTCLVEEGRVQLIGVIRMEILCGIRDRKVFDRIKKRLEPFPDRLLESEVFVLAAQFLNLCRKKGIQGSNNDFIMCACSVFWRMPILSKDKDYQHYSAYLPIEILMPRELAERLPKMREDTNESEED